MLRPQGCTKDDPIFFQKKCDFVFSAFSSFSEFRIVLVQARESYSSFGIFRSLIFYFSVAEAL